MSPQSTVSRKSSMIAASPSHHTQVQHTISSTMAGMQLTSSVSQLQPTPFPSVHKEITSIESSDNPPPPTQRKPPPILELHTHTPTSVVSSSSHYSMVVVGFPSHSVSVVADNLTTSELL